MTPHYRLLAAAALAASLVVLLALNSPAQHAGLMKPNTAVTAPVTLSGTVTLTGDAPEEKQLDLSADPVCERERPNATYEAFVVKEGKLANVLVYVTSETLLQNYAYPPPTSAAVLGRKQCRFEPRVFGVRVGQPLEIVNRDYTQHNTHPMPRLNKEWNVSQAAHTQIFKAFEQPELLIPVRCNQHPWEISYVSVFNHPFFAVSDEHGSYKIEGLPPGSYKVTAWHEKLGEKTVELQVLSGASQALDFNYAVTDPAGSN